MNDEHEINNGDIVITLGGKIGSAIVLPDGAVIVQDTNGDILAVDEVVMPYTPSEYGGDAPDTLTIKHAETGDADDYDQLRIERGQFETDLFTAHRTQDQLRDELVALDAQNKRLCFALERIAAIGSTGTVFQSDFEYAVKIAKDALLANQDE